MPSPMARAPSASPSRNLDSQLETLYNTAVQSFVRRDHVTTQVTLSRLLKLFKSLQPPSTEPWYDLRHQAKDGELEGWLVKTLKLVISSHASLYTDPPVSIATLPSELRKFLPPSPPEVLLSHLKNLCTETVFPPRSPDPGLLPPSLLSTLLLASITLSLPFTHHLAEDWIALLPDAFILAISPENRKVPQDPETKKRVEAAREGYLKVVELFVGEVLAREGEWEMARGFLDGEAVMGSKRKENLYRHLRALQTKPRSTPSSPANSAILPSPSSSPKPNGNGNGRTRSRSSSTSSSSSERTARPTNVNGLASTTGNGVHGVERKGKGRASLVEEERSESSVPSKIYIDHPSPRSETASTRLSGLFGSMIAIFPQKLQSRLGAMSASDWLASSLAIPLPIICLAIAFISIRRRLVRKRGTDAPSVVAGTATLATQAIDDVRARLMRARGQGIRQWVRYWLRWWAGKFSGVWKLGTTITYV